MGGLRAPGLARRVPAIPAADVDSLRAPWLRTTAVRLALALLLVAAVAAAVVIARALQPGKAAFLPEGTTGIVVLDVSLSVTDPVYRRIYNTLRMLSDSGQPVGMVAFSDTAYELLPTGSPPRELRSVLRYFEGVKGANPQVPWAVVYPPNPWNAGFSGGTKISTGLGLAQELLQRDGIEGGSILLVSDLDTAPSDEPGLSAAMADLRSLGIQLRVVPLFPDPQDRAFFVQVLGEEALITPPQLAAGRAVQAETRLLGASPTLLALLGGFVLLLLCVNEWWGARVELARRPA